MNRGKRRRVYHKKQDQKKRFAKIKEIPRENNTRRKKYWKRRRQIVHRDRIIPARSLSFSSSYLVDTDRDFTAKSMLTRKSLWKCSWGPGADTLNHTGTHTHTHMHFLNLPYPWCSARFVRPPLDVCPSQKRHTSKEARTQNHSQSTKKERMR